MSEQPSWCATVCPGSASTVSPVDTSDPAPVAAAIRPNTKMLWIETPANPIMRLSDIAALSRLAREREGPRRRGRFHLRDADRHAARSSLAPISSSIRSPNISAAMAMRMGGAVLGRKADLDALNLEAVVHYGGVLSPFNAWLILRGAATLPIRMKAHEETAIASRALP